MGQVNESTGVDNSTGILGAIPTGVTISNSLGRMVEAETDDCTWPVTQAHQLADEWFSYSARGELTDVYESTPHSGGYYHTTASYFENGAVKTLGGIPGQTSFTYGVDSEGRPKTAVQGSTNLVTATTFNTAGQPLVVTLGLGDSDTYAYDPNTGRMSSYTFTLGSTPTSIVGNLTWNPNGTLSKLAITDGFNAGGTQTCKYGDPSSSVPGYDDLGRLIKVDCSASVWQQNFSYDPFGNLTKTVPTGGTGIAWNPGYNATNNRYTLAGTSYDANGNLLTDTFHTYTWDTEGHPVTIDSTACGTNGTCATYDAFGSIVEKNVAGTYNQYLYSPIGKLGLMNGQTLVNAYIPLPGGEIYNTAPGYARFWHRDWLGTVRLSSTRNNRSVDYDRAFAPFGETYKNFGSTGNNSFTGNTQDTVTGTYDTPNRELNPSQGRWLSPDLLGIGAAGPGSPHTWNRYAYVTNNPMNMIDPSGLLAINACYFDNSCSGYDGAGFSAAASGAGIDACGIDAACVQQGGIGPFGSPVSQVICDGTGCHVGSWVDSTYEVGGNITVRTPAPKGEITINCSGSTTSADCSLADYTSYLVINDGSHKINPMYPGLAPGAVPDGGRLKELEKLVMAYDGTKQPLYNLMTSGALFTTGGTLLIGPWVLAPEVCFGSGGLACGAYIYGAAHVSVGGLVLLKGGYDFTKSVTIPSIIDFFTK